MKFWKDKEISKKEITKTYNNLIRIAQTIHKSEWETPIQTNMGVLNVKIILSQPEDETEPKPV